MGLYRTQKHRANQKPDENIGIFKASGQKYQTVDHTILTIHDKHKPRVEFNAVANTWSFTWEDENNPTTCRGIAQDFIVWYRDKRASDDGVKCSRKAGSFYAHKDPRPVLT